MNPLLDALGLARSVAIYYGMPWRNAGLRRLYGQLVGPGDLAFDIGAHVGNRTRALTALGARVVAVEPQRLFHAFLARTLDGNRVHLRRAAVAAHPGEVEMRVSRAHPTVSSGDGTWLARVAETPGFRRVRWDRMERVPGVTLDQLIDAYGEPAFCKLDVEGMEVPALRGLSRALPRLSFEVLPEAREAGAACLDRLGELGAYRFNLVEGEDAAFAWPDWCDAAAVLDRLAALRRSADLYAVRADLELPS